MQMAANAATGKERLEGSGSHKPFTGAVSVITSPSIDAISSFSSESLGDDAEVIADTKSAQTAGDFQISIGNPEKHVNVMETFVSFQITTKVLDPQARPDLIESEYKVRRRYNDFLWLRSRLVSENPTHIIPPLPEKHNLKEQLDRYSREFIHQRIFLLQKFILRLADHPTLSFNKYFIVFLTAKPATFIQCRRHEESILSRLSSSMHNLVLSHSPRSPEFQAVSDYISNLGEKLHAIEKIAHRIHLVRKQYVKEEKELPLALNAWASAEQELSHMLHCVLDAIEKCNAAHKHLLTSFVPQFLLPLHEYTLYVDAVKEALIRRDHLQVEHERMVQDLEKKRLAKAHVEAGQGDSAMLFSAFFNRGTSDTDALRDERLEKLDNSIQDLQKSIGEKGDRTAIGDADFCADLERWHSVKDQDLKTILSDHANRHVLMYEEVG
ncbi:unnamed protein product [Darwinula stevensoni]|uniref:PX domain-containing protein n=1 Tax=Darwinula stevensoni TaxID=69355 RepID=A0A7R9ADW6_9CRUS|nr:unnamed protein product [Darwinula stevensoni]CAG0901719.1 unnamed protein product [Darwinula stevensoni]